MENVFKKSNILGVGFTTAKEDKILEYILAALKKGRKNKGGKLSSKEQIIVFTPNPEQVSQAFRHRELQTLLNQAQISLPDGVGILWASRLLGKPIYARITGVDFMEKLVKSISCLPAGRANQPVITGYYGGQEGVAEATANCLQKKWPTLHVGYASHAYDKQKLIQSDIDLLFVALGFPKQERWILEHKDELSATVIMAVGGSFDFISGFVPRAPKILRLAGLEWLFRLILEPVRFRRQLQIWRFGGLIFWKALTDRLKRLKT